MLHGFTADSKECWYKTIGETVNLVCFDCYTGTLVLTRSAKDITHFTNARELLEYLRC